MKKILIVLVALMLVASVAMASGAGVPNRFNQDQNVMAYVSQNTSNGSYATENVSTATITPGYHRILGFTVAPCALGGETAQTDVALVDDDDDVMATSAAIFAESEASANTTETIFFPYPKTLTNGLTIRHGPNSVVIVYYEYYRQ
jgi:hypothetical protein